VKISWWYSLKWLNFKSHRVSKQTQTHKRTTHLAALYRCACGKQNISPGDVWGMMWMRQQNGSILHSLRDMTMKRTSTDRQQTGDRRRRDRRHQRTHIWPLRRTNNNLTKLCLRYRLYGKLTADSSVRWRATSSHTALDRFGHHHHHHHHQFINNTMSCQTHVLT